MLVSHGCSVLINSTPKLLLPAHHNRVASRHSPRQIGRSPSCPRSAAVRPSKCHPSHPSAARDSAGRLERPSSQFPRLRSVSKWAMDVVKWHGQQTDWGFGGGRWRAGVMSVVVVVAGARHFQGREGWVFSNTHTTICLRPRRGLRMNLRVRRVTGVSESAILTISLSTVMIVWWWVKMGECWSWEYFFLAELD
jgi:hypothetical protein